MDLDFDSMFDDANSAAKTQTTQEQAKPNNGYNNYNNYNNGGKKEYKYWDDANIKPTPIDASKLDRTEKTLTVAIPKDCDIPEDVQEYLATLVKSMVAKGFTYRYCGGPTDRLQTIIISSLTIDNELKDTEVYLPWAKYNEEVTPILARPSMLAYQIAANMHKRFANFKQGLRTIFANFTHLMLGKDCNKPLTMLIVYSDCGTEIITRNTDYSKLGNLVYFISVAMKADIPVFNIKNKESVGRLKEHILHCLKS